MSLRRPIFAALVPVICPPEPVAMGLTTDIVDEVERAVSALPPLIQRGMTLGLVTFDQGARVFNGARGRAFRQLPLDVARHYFYTWLHSPLPPQKQLARGVKQLVALSCYEHPKMADAIGYTPDAWIDQVRTRRLRVHHDAIAQHRAATFAPDPLRPGKFFVRAERGATGAR